MFVITLPSLVNCHQMKLNFAANVNWTVIKAEMWNKRGTNKQTSFKCNSVSQTKQKQNYKNLTFRTALNQHSCTQPRTLSTSKCTGLPLLLLLLLLHRKGWIVKMWQNRKHFCWVCIQLSASLLLWQMHFLDCTFATVSQPDRQPGPTYMLSQGGKWGTWKVPQTGEQVVKLWQLWSAAGMWHVCSVYFSDRHLVGLFSMCVFIVVVVNVNKYSYNWHSVISTVAISWLQLQCARLILICLQFLMLALQVAATGATHCHAYLLKWIFLEFIVLQKFKI